MALRILMIRKRLEDKRSERKKLQEALDAARERKNALTEREAELESDIAEANTEEERAAVEAAVAEFETESAEAATAETEAQNALNSLDEEIAGLENELETVEKEADPPAPEANTNSASRSNEAGKETRTMKLKTRDIRDMSFEERTVFFEREDMKGFVTTLRAAIQDKRAITNVGLSIPESLLGMLRDRTATESKLIPFVTYHRRRGTGRELIEGTIPEAVWTEICANLNELTLGFNDVELDGYEVGGFIPVCNAYLEESDFDLVEIVLTAIAKAIAKALDKAIVYGTGVKMPLGFVTRLAQTSQPAGYPATARTWVDLHTSNVLTGTGATGTNLIKEIVARSGVAKGTNANTDGLVWIMNHKTHVAIMGEALAANAAGLLVPGLRDEMPVVGGRIIEEDFMPDNNVAFGYLETYVLLERGEVRLDNSEHVKFLQNKTVFRGTGRFDGTPAIAENFGILTIVNTAPTTSVSFAEDSANPS